MLWLWERIADGDWTRLSVHLGERMDPPEPHAPEDLGSPLSCDINAWLERTIPGFDLQLGCALCAEAAPGSLRFSDPPGPRRGQERGVIVGVDMVRWRAADLAGKRSIAIASLLAAVAHASPDLAPQLPPLRAAFADEARRWEAMRRQAGGQLALPASLTASLTRAIWLSQAPAEREATARVLEDALREAGLALLYEGLREVHPADGPAVASWRDAENRAYVLVPGTERFAPGYPDPVIDRAFPAHDFGDRRDLAGHPDLAEQDTLRASLRRRPALAISPALLAVSPQPATRWGATWPEVAAALTAAGAHLPSAAEWEWALRADRDDLYPWGDQPPESNALEELFVDAGFPPRNQHAGDIGMLWSDHLLQLPASADEPTAWPLTSRAGLLRPQATPIWCLTDDRSRLRHAGGRHGSQPPQRMLCALSEPIHTLSSALMTRLQPSYRLASPRRGE